MPRSPTALLREGIPIPAHGCRVPWLVTKAELFEILPAEVWGIGPESAAGQWPRLSFNLLGYEATFHFDFVSHSERRLFVISCSNEDRETVEQTFAASSHALRSTLGALPAVIQHDEHLRWEADGLWIDNSIHESRRAPDGPMVRVHRLEVTAAFALPFARPARKEREVVLPKRTHKSSLHDADLLLLDFLWDKRCAPRLLRRDQYSFHMNVRWNHDLDDEALDRRCAQLLASGLIEWDGDVLQLTPEGGAEWERERDPRWPLYVTRMYYDPEATEDEEEEEVIVSPSRTTAEIYLRVAIECGLCAGPFDAWTMFEPSAPLVYFRSFESSFGFRSQRAQPSGRSDPCWETYNRRRTWWQNILELQSLL